MTLYPLIFALAICGQEATYHVAPYGDDARTAAQAGVVSTPWRTIQHAVDAAVPGEVIVVEAGTYPELVVAYRRPGPITLTAKAGAIIDGGCTRTVGLRLFDSPDWTVDGLTVQRVEGTGIAMDSCSDRTVLRNCLVRECKTGIAVLSSDGCSVESCEATACSVGIIACAIDIPPGRGFEREGAYVPCLRPTIRGCLSHDNTRDNPPWGLEGNDGIVARGTRDALIVDCLAWSNPDDGIDSGAGGGGGDYPLGTRIEGCRSWHNGWMKGGGDGNGIKINTNAGGGAVVYRCICWGNEHAGLDLDKEAAWPADGIVNCTFTGNGTYGLALDLAGVTAASSAPVVVNCILGGNLLEAIHLTGPAPTRQDHNWTADASCLRDPTFTPTIPTTGTIAERWQAIRSQIDEHFGLMPGSACVSAGAALPDFPPDFLDLGALPSRALPQPTVEPRTTRLIRSAAETLFYACASGPGMPLPAPVCGVVDLDLDGDVDLDDFGLLGRIER